MAERVEGQTLDQMINDINKANAENGDPPLMQLGPNGLSPAMSPKTMMKLREAHEKLLAENKEFQSLMEEGTKLDGRLIEIGTRLNEMVMKEVERQDK